MITPGVARALTPTSPDQRRQPHVGHRHAGHPVAEPPRWREALRGALEAWRTPRTEVWTDSSRREPARPTVS